MPCLAVQAHVGTFSYHSTLLVHWLYACPCLHAGLDNILQALDREHSQYEHVTYYPVAVAANDEAGLAFVGVAWEYKSLQGQNKDK